MLGCGDERRPSTAPAILAETALDGAARWLVGDTGTPISTVWTAPEWVARAEASAEAEGEMMPGRRGDGGGDRVDSEYGAFSSPCGAPRQGSC